MTFPGSQNCNWNNEICLFVFFFNIPRHFIGLKTRTKVNTSIGLATEKTKQNVNQGLKGASESVSSQHTNRAHLVLQSFKAALS